MRTRSEGYSHCTEIYTTFISVGKITAVHKICEFAGRFKCAKISSWVVSWPIHFVTLGRLFESWRFPQRKRSIRQILAHQIQSKECFGFRWSACHAPLENYGSPKGNMGNYRKLTKEIENISAEALGLVTN